MWKVAWKSVTSHPMRLVATALSIVLGVGFFVGTGVLTTTARNSINTVVSDAFANVDVVVRSAESVDTGAVELRPKIPADLAEQIETVDGVADVDRNLTGYAQVIASNGKVLDGMSIGYTWSSPDLNPFAIAEGRAPQSSGEIVVDRATFDDGDLSLGQTVRLLPAPPSEQFTIVGTATYGDADSLLNQRAVLLGVEDATSLFGTEVDQIHVGVDRDASVDDVAAAIEAALPSDYEVVPGQTVTDEFQNMVEDFTGVIDTALQVFAAIALGVGIFIIYNTFTVVVAQRTREMALLRAIGATGRQVRASVLAESLVLGLIASAIGAVLGLGIGWLLLRVITAFGVDLGNNIDVPAGTIGVAMGIGVVITLGSAYLPARRAARVAPMEAIRSVAAGPERISRLRVGAGAVLGVLGVVEVVRALGPGTAWDLAVAAVAFLAVMIVLGPIIDPPLARGLGEGFGRIRGITAQLAGDNAARNGKRTATTAAALLIGITLVSAATVFASSVSASVYDQLDEQMEADIVVEVNPTVQQVGGGLTDATVDTISRLPEVATASATKQANAAVDGGFVQVIGIDPATIDSVISLDVDQGSLSALDDQSVSVAVDTAADRGLTIGDTVTLFFPQGPTELTVAALHRQDTVLSSWLVPISVLDANTTQNLFGFVFVEPSGEASAAREAIEKTLAGSPIATAQSAADFIDGQVGQIDVLLYVLYGLLGVSVLVAVIGIVNTLALAVIERTREIGLLRAVGMTRGQVRASIRWEAAFVAVIGTVLGLAVGVLMAWLGSRAVQDTFAIFSIPWTTLAIIAVAGMICGIAAGALPARRAARLDVLQAIATH